MAGLESVCICGAPVEAHYRHGRKVRTCEQARRVVGYSPVNVGTLLRLALEKHSKAKQDAVDSIRSTPRGGWEVRLGGRYKGFKVTGKTLTEIHDLINSYFAEKWKQRRLRPETTR